MAKRSKQRGRSKGKKRSKSKNKSKGKKGSKKTPSPVPLKPGEQPKKDEKVNEAGTEVLQSDNNKNEERQDTEDKREGDADNNDVKEGAKKGKGESKKKSKDAKQKKEEKSKKGKGKSKETKSASKGKGKEGKKGKKSKEGGKGKKKKKGGKSKGKGGKKGKKKEKEKPLTPKELAALEAQQAEEAALRIETENVQREEQLGKSKFALHAMQELLSKYRLAEKERKEWEDYIACLETPIVSDLPAVNTYMTEWTTELGESPRLDKIFKYSAPVLTVINQLNDLLMDPPDWLKPNIVKELGMLYHEFKERHNSVIKDGTYTVIQDLTEYYDPEVGVFEYIEASDDTQIKHALWGNLYTSPDINGHQYSETGFNFQIPPSLLNTKGVYRLLKTEYDHYSDTSSSYFSPQMDNALKNSSLDWKTKKNEGKPQAEAEAELVETEEPKKGQKRKRGKKAEKKKSKKKKGKKGRKSSGESSSAKSDLQDQDADLSDLEWEDMDPGEGRHGSTSTEDEPPKAKSKAKEKKKGKKGRKKGKASPGSAMDSGSESEPVRKKLKVKYDHDDNLDPPDENDFDLAVEELIELEGELAQEMNAETKSSSKKKRSQNDGMPNNENDQEFAGEWNEEYDGEDQESFRPKKRFSAKENESEMNPDDTERNRTDEKLDTEDNETLDSSKAETNNDVEMKDESRNQSVAESDTGMALFKKKAPKGKKSKGKKKSKRKGKKSKKKKKGGKKSQPKKKQLQTSDSEQVFSDSETEEEQGEEEEEDEEEEEGEQTRGRSRTVKRKKGETSSAPGEEDDAKPEGKSKSPKPKKEKSQSKSKEKAPKSPPVKKEKKTEEKKKGKGGKSTSKEKSKGKNKSKSKDKAKGGKVKGKGGKAKSKRGKGKSAGGKGKSKGGKGKSKGKKGKSKGKKGKSKKGKKGKKKDKGDVEEGVKSEKEALLPTMSSPNELNLRKYFIEGGTYDFRLVEVPPQPKQKGEWILHLIESDLRLKEIPWTEEYAEPELPNQNEKTPSQEKKLSGAGGDAGEGEGEGKAEADPDEPTLTIALPAIPEIQAYETPEEIAEREKKEYEDRVLEREKLNQTLLKKLLSMKISLPKTTLWFDPPIPVRWDPENFLWTKEGFHDVKFDYEKNELDFRTQEFGVIGFGANRVTNLPYRSWELKPLGYNTAQFTLHAAKISLEFTIKDNLVALTKLYMRTPEDEERLKPPKKPEKEKKAGGKSKSKSKGKGKKKKQKKQRPKSTTALQNFLEEAGAGPIETTPEQSTAPSSADDASDPTKKRISASMPPPDSGKEGKKSKSRGKGSKGKKSKSRGKGSKGKKSKSRGKGSKGKKSKSKDKKSKSREKPEMVIPPVVVFEEIKKELINKYFNVPMFIKTMKEHGLDVFPEDDAYAYLDDIFTKTAEVENHLYECMALVSPNYEFSWSKWNRDKTERDRIVFLMREHESTEEKKAIMNNWRQCAYVTAEESSEKFIDTLLPNTPYAADLITLVGNIETNTTESSVPFIEAIRQLISSVRPFSYS